MQQNVAREAAIDKVQLKKDPTTFKQPYFSTEVNAHMCRLFSIQKPKATSKTAQFHQIY